MNTEHNEPRGPEGEIHPEEVRNREVGYDRTDMDPKAIVGFFITLAIAGVFMHLILWSVYKYYAGPAKLNPSVGPIPTSMRQMPKGNPERTFPAPRLQSNDAADMDNFRAQERQILNSYGAGRIPIDQAMQALVKRGLPMRSQMSSNAAGESAQAPAPGSGGAETKSEAGEVPSSTTTSPGKSQ